MILYLLTGPWAASAAHRIEAASERELRAALVTIPEARWAVAVEDRETDPAGRPFVVAWYSGAAWPAGCASADGFLAIWTGLQHADRAADWWNVIEAFPRQNRAAHGFLNGVADLTRRAVYPAPKLVGDDDAQ